MLPFADAFISQHEIPDLPLIAKEVESLPHNLESLCMKLSKEGELAYVEAEFFGGTGIQAGAVFANGALIMGPIIGGSSINKILVSCNLNHLNCINLTFDNFKHNTDATLVRTELALYLYLGIQKTLFVIDVLQLYDVLIYCVFNIITLPEKEFPCLALKNPF